MEVRDLLSKYNFPGDDTPIVIGSALKALEVTRVKLECHRREIGSGDGRLFPGTEARYRQAIFVAD